ncbi:MAG: NPCBM/NEW2 domain-containing protein [Gammaproteobacteria bacterium]
MSGRKYERAFFCNLYSAGVGSLDFVLGNSYRELQVTIGTADDSDWRKHRVKFEIIGDDKINLANLTLESGETRDLTVNVMGMTRLKLNITELGPGTSDSPSRPVWASPIAVPRS